MKNLNITLLIAAILSITSCKKDFLEIPPPSQLNSDAFYNTESDLLQALSAAYAAQRGIYTGKTSGLPPLLQLEDVRSDDYANGNTNDDVMDLFHVDGGSEWYRWNWIDSYYAINAANTVIDRATKITMDDVLKSRIVSEAKFIRAQIYFLLNQDYGGVPLVLNETISFESDKINVPRSSIADTYKQIEADLIDAASNLPKIYTGSDIGRATWGAAKGLLGKVYLQEGKKAEAAAALNEVVSSGLYALLPDYKDVFAPDNHNNKESLFEIQHLANFAGSTYGNNMATPNWGGVGAGQNYDLPAQSFLSDFEPGDLRMVGLTKTDPIGKIYSVKYLDPNMSTGFQGNTNFPVLRYADVLLLLAEALGESSQSYDYINLVRDRAGLPDISQASPGTFIDKVYKERRYELSFELNRWHDILRLGDTKAIELMNNNFIRYGMPNRIDAHDLLHAIPVTVVQVTNGIVKQNAGYP
ncbi:MAG: RagB/SusD family nutrient uptake outer membrane protein [Ferruginibacter sp.]